MLRHGAGADEQVWPACSTTGTMAIRAPPSSPGASRSCWYLLKLLMLMMSRHGQGAVKVFLVRQAQVDLVDHGDAAALCTTSWMRAVHRGAIEVPVGLEARPAARRVFGLPRPLHLVAAELESARLAWWAPPAPPSAALTKWRLQG